MEPPVDAASWARKRGWNPVVTMADLDGNGFADWAALGTSRGKSRLAVCMNADSRLRLLVIDDPYCADLVYRSKARSQHHNHETGRNELIENERAHLRRIIDSD